MGVWVVLSQREPVGSHEPMAGWAPGSKAVRQVEWCRGAGLRDMSLHGRSEWYRGAELRGVIEPARQVRVAPGSGAPGHEPARQVRVVSGSGALGCEPARQVRVVWGVGLRGMSLQGMSEWCQGAELRVVSL